MSFCGLTKGISPKICILCVRVKINKRLFGPVCVWISSERLWFVWTCLCLDLFRKVVVCLDLFVFGSLQKGCGLWILSCDFVPHN